MKTKRIIMALLFCVMLSLTGCEGLRSNITSMKGDIVGNTFNIDTFDNYGNLVLQTSGEKINVEPNIITEYSYSDDGWIRTKTLSSVITINVDGHQMESCGDTCIFYDSTLKPDYDFVVNKIESSSDSILDSTAISGSVNRVKIYIGKSSVVIIKSQLGQPIYVFSGDSVYWEIPDNLPKFTKLSIDGKPLYIHRANFQIIDKALL